MPTAYKSVYLTVGSLFGGSKAIDCFDHDGIEGASKRHVGNAKAAGVAGSVARAPIGDELIVPTEWRISGRYDQDNGSIAKANWVTNYYTLLDVLMATLESNALQTVTLVKPGGNLTGQGHVVELNGPVHGDRLREIATVRAVLVLPNGALT